MIGDDEAAAAKCTATEQADRHEDALRATFGVLAATYDERVLQIDRDYTAFDRVPAMVLRHVRAGTAMWALDLGCGTGLSSRRLFEDGQFRIVGVDLTPEMLAQARAQPYEALVCQSLDDLPLRVPSDHGGYDVVLLLGVTEFLRRPAELFADVARLCRPDALLGVTFPKQLPQAVETALEIRTYAAESLPGLLGPRWAVLESCEMDGWRSADGHAVDYCAIVARRVQADEDTMEAA